MNGQYRPGDVVLGNWHLTRQIGEGSFGKVYEAIREDFNVTYRAAIKIITIPQSSAEVKSAQSEGMDEASVTAYFRSFVEDIVQEFVLMSKLKGHSNVVSYEDHTVIPHTQGVGWDIIIRMELLTPLLDYMQSRTMARKDVIQLGIHICKALELCQKFNIIHRDIKPENIFVSDLGDYKLGDFGIARTVEKTTGGLSKKGTYTYMAPEVYKEEPYGSSVDLYSLGLVMYRLLNNNRAPFLPDYPALITHSDRENSLAKRMSGAKLPPPKHADGRLAEIVLKACAYQPKERYSSPMQMAQELEAILYNRGEAEAIYPQGDQVPLRTAQEIPTGAPEPEERTESVFSASFRTERTETVFASPDPSQEERTESIFGTSAGSAQPNVPGRAKAPKSQKAGEKKLLPILAGGAVVLVGLIAFFVMNPLGSGGSQGYYDYTPPSYQEPSGNGEDTPSAPIATDPYGDTSSNPSGASADSDISHLQTKEFFPKDGYIVAGCSMEIDDGVFQTDLTEFMESTEYEVRQIGNQSSPMEVERSCVPYCVILPSRSFSELTAEELEDIHQRFIEEVSESAAVWERYLDYANYAQVVLMYCTPDGERVSETYIYVLHGNQLLLYPFTYVSDAAIEVFTESYIEYDVAFVNNMMSLERNGNSVTLTDMELIDGTPARIDGILGKLGT